MHTMTIASAAAARATSPAREWIRRVDAEYREMPGLSLTLPQAARLFGLDAAAATEALEALVERQLLARTRNGMYVRAEAY
jgi:hypothetical protein